MADAKSVWSWWKIVENSAEFLCMGFLNFVVSNVDSRTCVRVGNDMSEWFVSGQLVC